MSPAPRPSHQAIVFAFARVLEDFVRSHHSGRVFISPVDVVLTARRAIQPDVLFISNDRLHIVQDRIRGIPDLVAEVISEGTWRRDRVDKKALYEQFSLPEYWSIDPESRSIEVFVLVEGAYHLHCKAAEDHPATSKLLLGFAVSCDALVRLSLQ